MAQNQCLSSIEADSLVKSIISKMMYTCTNPYCRHRVTRCSASRLSNAEHYNCPHFPRLQGPIYPNNIIQSQIKVFPCGCYGSQNPQEITMNERQNFSRSRYDGKCLACTPAAGDFSREQQRYRWVNNSLHSGKKMKKVIYQSEDPKARVQTGPFGKNYDAQYQMLESRIQRTRAPSPKARTKIASLVRRDRDRRP